MRDIAVCISNDNKNMTPIKTINAIKEAGFNNVFIQWYDKVWEITQEQQLEYIRSLGMNVVFAHLGYQKLNTIWEDGSEGDVLVERYLKDLEVCKINNISMVIMHPVSKSTAPPYNERGLNRLKRIVKYAKELDIKVAFENTKIKGYLEYILTNIKDDNVGICFDSGHCHVHFDDEFNFEIFKDRIFAVHFHDNDKSDDQHLLPFEGTIDWKQLVKNLKDSNYNGPITLELCYRGEYLELSPVEFYKKGYETAKTIAEMFEE